MPSRRQYDEVVADKLLSSHDGREDYTDCVAQSSMPKSLTKWKALGIGTSCLLAIYLMLILFSIVHLYRKGRNCRTYTVMAAPPSGYFSKLILLYSTCTRCY